MNKKSMPSHWFAFLGSTFGFEGFEDLFMIIAFLFTSTLQTIKAIIRDR